MRERFMRKAFGPVLWIGIIGLMLFAGSKPRIGGPIFLGAMVLMMGAAADGPWRWRNTLVIPVVLLLSFVVTVVALLILNGPTSI